MSRIRPLKKIALTASTAVLATVGMITVGQGAAHANTSHVVSLSPLSIPLLWMQVKGASTASTASIVLGAGTGGANQQWNVKPVGSNYEVVNLHSGKCVITDGVPGDQLFQGPCTGSAPQLWDVNDLGGGVWTFRNPRSNLYMDVYGGSTSVGAAIDAWYWNDGSNQKFIAGN
jgi:hypothetical protein